MSEINTTPLDTPGETIYPERTLGLGQLMVEKSESMSPLLWSVLLFSNARVGEVLYFDGLGYEVLEANAEHIKLKDDLGEQHIIQAEHVYDHPLILSLAVHLNTLHPEYTDPLCYILERDPAVFRLRTQTGWVINDALWKSSGNVQYTQTPDLVSRETSKTHPIQGESDDIVQTAPTQHVKAQAETECNNSLSEPFDMKDVTISATGQFGFGF